MTIRRFHASLSLGNPAGYALARGAYYYHSPWYDPFLYGPPRYRVTVVHPMPYYYHHPAAGPRRVR